MPTSVLYMGSPADHEDRLRKAVGADLEPLHVAAQRISWGLLMGSRLGVDIDDEVDALLRRYDDQFAAHVTIALARSAQGRPDHARKHLERARQLVTSDHPWAALVPTDEAWHGELPKCELIECEPGRVYRVPSANRVADRPFGNPGVATFLRVESGELVCINPVQMDESMGERVQQLGRVTHIIAPAKYHNEHVPRAQKLFPAARTWGVPAHRRYPNVSAMRFDGYLDDDAPLFPDEIDQVTIRGVDVGDVWFVDRASRTLLVTDALFLCELTPESARYTTPFSTFYAWAWGVHDRVGIPSYQPAMWQDVRAFQASIRRVLDLDFDHVGSSHGPWHAIEGNGRAAVRRALGWILELGSFDALRLLGNFVRRHPGIFMRLVREQIQARKAKR